GDLAERRIAARQLRELGRRVVPGRGSGWEGLSPREREVALLAAQGFGDRAIGDALFLSPRTVQGIVGRVMTAFDVRRRGALAPLLHARLADAADAAESSAAPLTPRQREVAVLVAEGCTNAQIASRLGISPRTVERHLSDAFTTWGLSSRTALAHRLLNAEGAARLDDA
ncbi:MAG: helix-turn-helix transcriptional regulator, partial [Leucobacter sp.]